MKTILLLLITLLLVSCVDYSKMTTKYDLVNNPNINLPEEYKLITKDTPIRGYMNKDSVLVIEFVHK